MTQPFDYFVVLAGMRTGSNLLEEQLAAMPGIVSHGELFNPHFFGKPDQQRQIVDDFLRELPDSTVQ